MAENLTFIGHVPVDERAGQDLRSHQHKFVALTDEGVFLSDARSVAYAATYVLALKANSGEACSLSKAPNVAMVVAGAAVVKGVPVEPGSNGHCFATSLGNANWAGFALSTAAGSGTLVSVDLRR